MFKLMGWWGKGARHQLVPISLWLAHEGQKAPGKGGAHLGVRCPLSSEAVPQPAGPVSYLPDELGQWLSSLRFRVQVILFFLVLVEWTAISAVYRQLKKPSICIISTVGFGPLELCSAQNYCLLAATPPVYQRCSLSSPTSGITPQCL